MQEKNYDKVLIIAGSDSGGGAGIQADIKTISACECYATNAITAITIQNTLGVTGIHAVPDNVIYEEIKVVLEDIGTDAVKIGMLHSSDTIKMVDKALDLFNIKNIVLDPVMVATSGDVLLQEEAISTLKTVLIPKVRVITPNIPEAEILLGKKIDSQEQLPEFAKELSLGGKVSVFLKAGHLSDDELIDVFYNAETDETLEFKSQRLDTNNTHGTGCTLSSAFASFLAKGKSLNEAAKLAKQYINDAIVNGKDYKLGEGHGPVKHFYNLWKNS